MHNYVLPKELTATFENNPWWTFMGKYFGFPNCCIQSFCESGERADSPFDGTGYVPCMCCNKKLNNDSVIQEFKDYINASRYHDKPFGMDDYIEDNPDFFSIMENFYISNQFFPYEEMLARGGQQYLYRKFLNQDFSFFVHVKNKKTKESTVVDLFTAIPSENFPWIFNYLVEESLTPEMKTMILEELSLHDSHIIEHHKTKANLTTYFKEVEHLMINSVEFFKQNIQKNPKNIAKKTPI